MSIESEIKELKSIIEAAKQEKAECEGALKTLMTQLKTEFGLNSIEDAELEAQSLEREIKKLKKEKVDYFTEVKRDFTW